MKKRTLLENVISEEYNKGYYTYITNKADTYINSVIDLFSVFYPGTRFIRLCVIFKTHNGFINLDPCVS